MIQNLKKFLFGTKAETLERLQPLLLKSIVPDCFYFHEMEWEQDPKQIANAASEFQKAVVDCLVKRTIQAVNQFQAQGILLGGGVAANLLLRSQMTATAPVSVVVPNPKLCTDNGAMIGAAAYFSARQSLCHRWDLDVNPSLKLG